MDLSGLICSLFASHQLRSLFNSELQFHSRCIVEVLLTTKQVSSAKSRGLQEVALWRSLTSIDKKK